MILTLYLFGALVAFVNAIGLMHLEVLGTEEIMNHSWAISVAHGLNFDSVVKLLILIYILQMTFLYPIVLPLRAMNLKRQYQEKLKRNEQKED